MPYDQDDINRSASNPNHTPTSWEGYAVKDANKIFRNHGNNKINRDSAVRDPHRHKSIDPHRPKAVVDPVDLCATWIAIIASSFFGIVLYRQSDTAWYWVLAASGVLVFGIGYIFKHPLRWVTRAIAYAIRVAISISVIAVVILVIWYVMTRV